MSHIHVILTFYFLTWSGILQNVFSGLVLGLGKKTTWLGLGNKTTWLGLGRSWFGLN